MALSKDFSCTHQFLPLVWDDEGTSSHVEEGDRFVKVSMNETHRPALFR